MSSILEALEKADEARGLDANGATRPIASKPRQQRLNPSLLGLVLLLIVLLSAAVWLFLRNDTAVEKQTAPVDASVTPAEMPLPSTLPSHAEQTVSEAKQKRSVTVPEQLKRTTLPSRKPLIEEAVVKKSSPMARPAPRSVDQPAPRQDQKRTPIAAPAQAANNPAPQKRAASQSLRKQLQALPLQAKRKLPAVVKAQLGEEVEAEEAVVAVPATDEVEQIPLVWELPQDLRERVLQMQSTIHVYSETPAQRFVIINMKRYQEGDKLPAEDLRLKRIERDGMVIDYGDGLVRLQGR
jgi:general secretion pathway protein B